MKKKDCEINLSAAIITCTTIKQKTNKNHNTGVDGFHWKMLQ